MNLVSNWFLKNGYVLDLDLDLDFFLLFSTIFYETSGYIFVMFVSNKRDFPHRFGIM